MSARGGRPGVAEGLYGLVVRLYPASFRAAYGEEMRGVFRELHRRRGARGAGALRFWSGVVVDVARSLPREWASTLAAAEGGARPPYGAAALAGLAVLALYVATLAPSIGFWDSGEYVTAAHGLGIPHPPGSPLFVLLGHAWEGLLAPTGLPVAVRLNLFAAALSAAAHALWFLVVDRALGTDGRGRAWRRVAAAAAVLVSATAFTVWSQSDVNEKVYAISFFTTALVSWLALRWRDTGRGGRRLLVIALVLALTATNHLMGVLAVPALALFAARVDRRALLRPRLWALAVPVLALGFSVNLFLPLRAAQRPVLSEATPACGTAAGAVESALTWGAGGCEALSAVLRREQYGKPPVTLDPTVYPQREAPRGAGLLGAQLLNYLQYFDWQWGRSVAGGRPLLGGARPLVSLVFLLLGLLGARTLARRDRESALYLGVLFLTLSAGLVLYLNFRYGYSIGWARFPDATRHEVRERDYFFVVGFGVWGLWAGVGVAELWRRAAGRLGARTSRARLVASPVLALAVVPLVLNARWASRADDYTARDWAYNVLMSVEPYGVLVTNGDNDTFPLWYLQEVEGLRRDVTVMVGSYLNAPWYVRQLRDLTEPCPPGVDPAARPARVVCQRRFHPEQLPAALARAGWTRGVQPPRDSILPLSDGEIDRIAGSWVVAREPMALRAGALETRIEAGTALSPADTFVAAMLRATLGARPVYFMPLAASVTRLGLGDHTVRQGLAWRIANGPVRAAAGVMELPRDELSAAAGAAIDLPLTDTLLDEVYLRRGRLLDPGAPWPDPATTSIAGQYLYARYAAAQAHALRGDADAAQRNLRRAAWWQARTAD